MPLELGAPWGSLAPRFAADSDSLRLTWLAPDGDSGTALWQSTLEGPGFGTPTRFARGSGWLANWADVPQVSYSNGFRTMAWLERLGESPWAYGIKVRTMAPDGAVDVSDRWLHADTSETEHGFVSMVPVGDAQTWAVWLDGRATAKDGPTQLRAARIVADGPPSHEVVLDSQVCDCCPTAAVRCPDGALLVAYRDRSDDEVRDIAVTRLDLDGWSRPRVVHRDEWKLAGCPVNGPALAVSDSVVALAWFAMLGGVDPAVSVAFSSNCGRNFGRPVRLDSQHAHGRVDVAPLGGGAFVVTWIEAADSVGTLWARRVGPDGADTAVALMPLSPDRSSGFPRLAAYDGRLYLAWTETGESTRVRAALLNF